jgi:NTP pyrophosphatase (non-canonical NTP hydrolase)
MKWNKFYHTYWPMGSLNHNQQIVDTYVQEAWWYFSTDKIIEKNKEEIKEIWQEINAIEKPISNDNLKQCNTATEKELGDVFFALSCLANTHNISLYSSYLWYLRNRLKHTHTISWRIRLLQDIIKTYISSGWRSEWSRESQEKNSSYNELFGRIENNMNKLWKEILLYDSGKLSKKDAEQKLSLIKNYFWWVLRCLLKISWKRWLNVDVWFNKSMEKNRKRLKTWKKVD